MPPLASCLMPTYDRRPFVPLAIERFLQQDYPDRELVILDDGDDPVLDLVPSDPRIRYHHLDQKVPLGSKRNLVCEAARGDVLIHWDDDDWYPSTRITQQVRLLTDAKADVCGAPSLLFWTPEDRRAWRYTYPRQGRPWVAGSSLCFTREWWRRRPFDPVGTGEDTRWLWRGVPPRVAVSQEDLVVAVLHGHNTSRTRPGGSRWRAVPEDVVRRLLGPDGERYRSAARGEASAQPAAPSGTPLVSCIMPTRNRISQALRAVEYFTRQDYPAAELVIVDDGTPGLEDRLPDDPRVVYRYVATKASIGAKRNRACSLAHGELIAQWDDDDWYGSSRLSRQIAPILAGRADITGLTGCLFLDTASGRGLAVSPQLHRRMFAEDVVGGTLVFRRSVLSTVRYPDGMLGEDAHFLRRALAHGARLERVPNQDQFVYVRHGQNTWQFQAGRHWGARHWTAHEPLPLSPADLTFHLDTVGSRSGLDESDAGGWQAGG